MSLTVQAPTSNWEKAGHLAIETYALIVRSSVNGAITTLSLGTIFYVAQKYLLKADMTVATPFEIPKLIACNNFIDNLFQPLENVVLQKKKLTYEELRKEVIYVQEPDWRKEAFEVLLFAASFFPKAYLSFRFANFVGCLGETIESNMNTLHITFYFFTASRLLNYSLVHFNRFVNSYKHPKCKPEWLLRLPGDP